MAFLNLPTAGAVPVDLDAGSAQLEYTEIGDSERAFDGTMHTSVRARKRSWHIILKRVPRATGDSIVSALEGTPPLSCSGDLLGGSVSCIYEPGTITHPKHADGEYQIIEFTLHER